MEIEIDVTNLFLFLFRFLLPFILLIESIGFMVQSVYNPAFYLCAQLKGKWKKKKPHTFYGVQKSLSNEFW